MVSTGRHHGFESLEEARVLTALDFAGDLVDVVSQPVRLAFGTLQGGRVHTPDYPLTVMVSDPPPLELSRNGITYYLAHVNHRTACYCASPPPTEPTVS